jgi:SAM-dependent methyltransferase
MIPWSVKNFLSKQFPLAYHLAVNAGLGGNSEAHWDAMLAETSDDPARAWPTKVEMLRARTRRTDRILDIGCGTGSILRALFAAGYRDLHALELWGYAVRRLSQEGIGAQQGRLPLIDYPDGTFDTVIASQVLEHVIRRRQVRARDGGAQARWSWIHLRNRIATSRPSTHRNTSSSMIERRLSACLASILPPCESRRCAT